MRRRIKRFLRRNNKEIAYVMAGAAIIMLFAVIVYVIYQKHLEDVNKKIPATVEITALPAPTEDVVADDVVQPTPFPEESVYTYLQGPKSWEERIDWSGEWGSTYYDGSSFGAFGCGLCCLANVYSTQSNYRCTPVDMYRFAKRQTYYEGGGAIAWGYMKNVLEKLGFSCGLKRKPKSYDAFKKQLAQTSCSIVLVSSYDSSCYWENTPGHYVTLFMYDEDSDRVFLADSGNPEHNRQWVSLRKIYKSLKTSSDWQYLNIGKYDKKQDAWKHKSVAGNWVRPDYMQD